MTQPPDRQRLDETTVTIEWHGDPSVGLFGGALTILDLPPRVDEDDREETRLALAAVFGEIIGEEVSVEWGDEIRAQREEEDALAAQWAAEDAARASRLQPGERRSK